MIYSAMQASCYGALSFYACCMKKNFTIIWSHVSFMLLLSCTLGTALGIYQQDYVLYIAGAGVITLVTSLVTFHTIALLDELTKEAGFYAAFRVQTDLLILCKKHCCTT